MHVEYFYQTPGEPEVLRSLGIRDLPGRSFPQLTEHFFCPSCGVRWAKIVSSIARSHTNLPRYCSSCGPRMGYISFWLGGTFTNPPELEESTLEVRRFTTDLPRRVLLQEILTLTTNILSGAYRDRR